MKKLSNLWGTIFSVLLVAILISFAGYKSYAQTFPTYNTSINLIAGSGNIANNTSAATLTGTAITTVYITGFEITGAGATVGIPVTCNVNGLLGGSNSTGRLHADFFTGFFIMIGNRL